MNTDEKILKVKRKLIVWMSCLIGLIVVLIFAFFFIYMSEMMKGFCALDLSICNDNLKGAEPLITFLMALQHHQWMMLLLIAVPLLLFTLVVIRIVILYRYKNKLIKEQMNINLQEKE